MGQSLRVSIVGESILAESVVVSLEKDPTFNVLQVRELDDDALQHITSFDPQVIVYPLQTPQIDELIASIRAKPGLRFVGLDLDCSQAIITESRLQGSLSLKSLEHLIAAQNEEPGWQIIGPPVS